MAARVPVPSIQQLRQWRTPITWATCPSSMTTRVGYTPRRSWASPPRASPPPPVPLASQPVIHDTIVPATATTTREDFATTFGNAAADAARDHLPHGGSRATRLQGPGRLSAWTEYLVGLRDVPPSNPFGGHGEDGGVSMREVSSTTRGASLRGDVAGAQDMFVHHLFDDVKETALYVTIRRPEEFLRAEEATNSSTRGGGFRWQLMPLSAALIDMEAVLQDMLLQEQKGPVKRGLTALPANAALTFWRAMLEQAFLAQYCDFAVTQACDLASSGGPQYWLHGIYPYDYSRQPARLRQRLERGIRALLCASAYTLHIHWEQHMTRHSPSDYAAQILGLELVMLWWWANPDQMTIELSLPATRLPPPTLQSLRQRESPADATMSGWLSDCRPSAPSVTQVAHTPVAVPSVEQHLQCYLAHHLGTDGADAQVRPQTEQQLRQQRRRRAVLREGGFLCPAAVFPPAYLDALRTSLAHVHKRKNHISSPLFPRLVEVALTVATTDAAASSVGGFSDSSVHPAQREPWRAAAHRGRDIALQLCHEWLWPVICGRSLSLSMPLTPHSFRPSATVVAHEPLNTAPMETVEDWAVLMAAVAAVSQVRGNLLALRRASKATVPGSPDRAPTATLSPAGGIKTEAPAGAIFEKSTDLAHVRDHLYTPLMRTLLTNPACALFRDGAGVLAVSGATVPGEVPDWAALVFARVSACFEEAGMLQRDVARQPATPARLWCLLFHSLCDTFPNVFHSGSAVTVMWAQLALEGMCAASSVYYGTYRAMNAGKTQTMSTWMQTLAAWNSPGLIAAEAAELTIRPSCVDESEIAAACALCPRSERCQRTAFVLSTAVVGTPANEGSQRCSGIGGSSANVQHGKRHRGVASLPSFASAPSPELPLQLNSPEALAQAQVHLASCTELCEETVTMSIEVFRRYATLPVLVTSGEPLSFTEPAVSAASVGEEWPDHSSCRPWTEAALSRPRGRPSLMVLLRLLQAVALFGDAGGPASDIHAGLVHSVADDVSNACHPVVAAHLRKLKVYAAAVSGRSGALALLHDETLQDALDSLPPSLGRQRLVKALLWSGLSVSALEKREEPGAAVYGSGSLAWYVLERNQQRFLAFAPHNASAAASVDKPEGGRLKQGLFAAHDATETGSDAGDGISSFAEVLSCLEDVLRHLWQLAIAIPDPARVALCLQPHVSEVAGDDGAGTGINAAGTVANGPRGGGAELTHCGGDDVMDHEPDTTLANSEEDAIPNTRAATVDEDIPDALEYASGAVFDSTADDWNEAEVERADTPPDWDTSTSHGDSDFDSEVAAIIPAREDAHPPRGSTFLWDSGAPVKSSAILGFTHSADDAVTTVESDEVPSEKRKHTIDDADSCNIPTQTGDYHALAQALLLATPAAQHIFYSLLEVLSWTAMPQASSAYHATSSVLACPLGHAQRPGDLGRQWCARLAANYSTCASVWRAHCNFVTSNATSTPGAAALCRSQTMERVTLILLHSCPDVFLVGLLLLAMAGGTVDAHHMTRHEATDFSCRVRRAGSLLPWSVESSLAQLLFHSGVTAANVRRWRLARGLTEESVARRNKEASTTAALLHVDALRTLLKQIHTQTTTKSTRGSTHTIALSVKSDLLLSIGSILLCSLEQRGAPGSQCRTLYRYNAYVNEFLHHRQPSEEAAECATTPLSPETAITALRVVLPSLQLKSSSPNSLPPQQIVSLRVAWKHRMTRSDKTALRKSFRSNHIRPTAATAAHTPEFTSQTLAAVTSNDENTYAQAFL
ncbi:hypothetical protein LSCM1_02568 [Leishmania martiniquensis]|uniref:Uncharacterized protein n=1 Tax=Leishmania martiniquensis TaxID=1580590 RepID=A0A836GSX6_9TRYP|nr:hypothetical protein LSCM1_02568 [Leishmania martiniquensis]